MKWENMEHNMHKNKNIYLVKKEKITENMGKNQGKR